MSIFAPETSLKMTDSDPRLQRLTQIPSFRRDMKTDPRLFRMKARQEGSIPFTRSADFRGTYAKVQVNQKISRPAPSLDVR